MDGLPVTLGIRIYIELESKSNHFGLGDAGASDEGVRGILAVYWWPSADRPSHRHRQGRRSNGVVRLWRAGWRMWNWFETKFHSNNTLVHYGVTPGMCGRVHLYADNVRATTTACTKVLVPFRRLWLWKWNRCRVLCAAAAIKYNQDVLFIRHKGLIYSWLVQRATVDCGPNIKVKASLPSRLHHHSILTPRARTHTLLNAVLIRYTHRIEEHYLRNRSRAPPPCTKTRIPVEPRMSEFCSDGGGGGWPRREMISGARFARVTNIKECTHFY